MSTVAVKDKYREETNTDVYAEIGKPLYKDDYVRWLEKQVMNNFVLDPVIHWQRFNTEKPMIGRNIIVKRTDLKYIPEVTWCEPVMLANLEIYKDTVEWAYV